MGTLGVRLSPKCEKEEPAYSEELIQKVLRTAVLSPSSVLYRTENLNVFAWESDSLAITKSKYAYEFEIKISRADFKNDFKHKKVKHQMLEGTYQLFGDEFLGDGKMSLTDKPNYFYYVVPENLITVEEVPTYAGLVYVKPRYNREGKIYWYDANVVKVAPKLHKEKIDETHLKLMEKFYYNDRSRKHRYEDDLTYYKKRLDEVTTIEGEKFKYTLPEAMQQIEVLTEENKKDKEDIESIKKERLYGIHLNRKLMKLLRDNNIEYEDMVREYDEEFWGRESKF
jgi:hypothetical protein